MTFSQEYWYYMERFVECMIGQALGLSKSQRCVLKLLDETQRRARAQVCVVCGWFVLRL